MINRKVIVVNNCSSCPLSEFVDDKFFCCSLGARNDGAKKMIGSFTKVMGKKFIPEWCPLPNLKGCEKIYDD